MPVPMSMDHHLKKNKTMKCPSCGNNVPDNELFCDICGMRVNIKSRLKVETKSDASYSTFSEWSRNWAEMFVENYEFWSYLVYEHIDDDDYDLPLIICIHEFPSRRIMQDAYVTLCEYERDLGFGVPSDYVFMSEYDNQWGVFLPCSDLPAVLLVAEHFGGRICGWADYFIPMPTMPISMDKSLGIKSCSSYAPARTKIHIRNLKSLMQRHMLIPSFKRIETPSASVKVSGTINGYGYVDLGLSVKWAMYNVGASSPEDYGNYYAWGEIITKKEYTKENCETYDKSIDDISGISKYDAAKANWGSSWRMPTERELNELEKKCTWKWTTENGVKGYKVTGPNGNSIFFPAAGYRTGSLLYQDGGCGHYWSSSPYSNSLSYRLSFNGSGYYGVSSSISDYRYCGYAVRPVSN